jgi:ADP-ribose pyrophosphatase YjhB (NUDIX family)
MPLYGADVGLLQGWRWCPRCRAELSFGEGRATCPDCGLVVYANAAPTASALVVDDRGRVLLARRAREPRAGCWDAPGGFLEEWEQPLDALRRELREETGLEIEPLDFVGVWVDRYGDEPDARATLNLYWTAHAVSGEAAPADDVSELRWFARDELPSPDELAFRNNAEALTEWSRSADPPS